MLLTFSVFIANKKANYNVKKKNTKKYIFESTPTLYFDSEIRVEGAFWGESLPLVHATI